MANDRLYIRCKVCGDLFYIGKNYGGPFYYENYKKLAGDEEAPPLEDLINDFFVSHVHCFSGSKKWNGDFELVYEDDDFVERSSEMGGMTNGHDDSTRNGEVDRTLCRSCGDDCCPCGSTG